MELQPGLRAAAILLLAIFPEVAPGSLDVGGYVRQHTSLLTDGGEYAVVENAVCLTIGKSRGDVAFRIDPYVYQRPDEELDLGLRQAYVDVYWSSVDLRVGKQQIVWGKADGVFITDVVSPKDLRRFILPDFDEIRIGVDAVKLDYYRGDGTLEIVWVPVFVPTLLPEEDSIWARREEFPVEPTFDRSSERVEPSLENSEVFAKWALLSSAFDFEVMSGYAWDDDPTLHMQPELDPDTHEVVSVVVRPKHHRLSIAGASMSADLWGTVVRGEGAYYWGKFFGTENPLTGDGVLKRDYAHYLLGVDRTVFGVRFSVQFVQQVVLDYDDRLAVDERSNVLTVLAGDDFLHDTLHLELFSYIGVSDGDALVRPKMSYDLVDGFEILVGADVFIGDQGMFGDFDENDMVYAKVKYSF